VRPNHALHPTGNLIRQSGHFDLTIDMTVIEKAGPKRVARRARSGAEPGGGARGPHRDAPSRVGCGGKQAEDLSEPANAGRASSAGPGRTLH